MAIRITSPRAARINSEESFSVAFSLSEVAETRNFVARREELAQMHEALTGEDGRRTVVLQGLGGIGKTQLAVAYAKIHKGEYSAIFWLNIKDEDSLNNSFARTARRIFHQHPSASQVGRAIENQNLDEIRDAVKLWLDQSKNSQWLLIFDNFDNPKVPGNDDPAAVDIHLFLPEVYHGSVLITTRSAKVKIGITIQMSKLNNAKDSLQIIADMSHRDGVMDGESCINFTWQG